MEKCNMKRTDHILIPHFIYGTMVVFTAGGNFRDNCDDK